MSAVQIVALALAAIGALIFLIGSGRLAALACRNPGNEHGDQRLMLIGASLALGGAVIGWINF